MRLQTGTRLGPYEILSPLGAGGMGEIWKARDTRLDREVAVKVLPPGLASNELFRARFTREAKAISSLNHPNICVLYDVGEVEDSASAGAAAPALHYLVLELVEGETLAARIKRGALPLPEVLRVGAQIAEALDAAHRRGIVHRDLKPENVMLTRAGAKLLDFGLARTASEGGAVISGLTSLPTQVDRLTTQGTILGTFQYMAPEQLEGLEADTRTDIFALGALLYEMATGRKAFSGVSKTSLIASIVSSQPEPISTIMPMTPPALDYVVRKCLEKDPEDRWQSARDVAGQLRWISEAGSQAGVGRAVVTSRRMRRSVLVGVALLGWAAAVGVLAWTIAQRRSAAPEGLSLRAELLPPPGVNLAAVQGGPAALSPDGSRLAFVGSTGARNQGIPMPDSREGIYMRSLSSGETGLLRGTEAGTFPFWSPDGRWLGFFSEGKLRKIPSTGGPVQVLCDAHEGRGGSWSKSGVIVFAPDIQGPLMQVPEGGGTPRPATRIPKESVTHRNPHFLPDGKKFLFTERETLSELYGHVALGSLDVGPSSTLVERASNPQFAQGYLLYVREGNLLAQRMDDSTGKLQGSPTPLADSVEYFNPRDLGYFTLSGSGDLIYRKRQSRKAQLVWVDPAARDPERVGDAGLYSFLRYGLNGKRSVLVQQSGDGGSSDIWIMDMSRGQPTRATFDNITGTVMGALSPDGSLLAVSSAASGGWGSSSTWLQSTSGGGRREMILESSPFTVTGWSPDGKYLVGGLQRPKTSFDIAIIDLKGSRKPEILLGTPFNESASSISPDGRWMTWASDESGQIAVYLCDFPAARQKWQISSGGGGFSFWSPDGSKIYYNTTQGLMAVDLGKGATPDPGKPTSVFRDEAVKADSASPFVATDGKRFLTMKYTEGGIAEPLRLVRNWQKTLRP